MRIKEKLYNNGFRGSTVVPKCLIEQPKENLVTIQNNRSSAAQCCHAYSTPSSKDHVPDASQVEECPAYATGPTCSFSPIIDRGRSEVGVLNRLGPRTPSKTSGGRLRDVQGVEEEVEVVQRLLYVACGVRRRLAFRRAVLGRLFCFI